MRHISNIFSYVISRQGFSTSPHKPLVFVRRIRTPLLNDTIFQPAHTLQMAENPGYVFHTYIVCAHTHSAVVLQNYYQITRQGSAGVQADGRHLSNHAHEVYRSNWVYSTVCSHFFYLPHGCQDP